MEVTHRGIGVPVAGPRQAKKRFPKGASGFQPAPHPHPMRWVTFIETRRNPMTHYTLTVPVKYDDNGTEKTTYRRVGAVFENTKRDSGETFLTVKLDFPVGVTELVAFQPNKGDVTE
jgi:hypothetical protein